MQSRMAPRGAVAGEARKAITAARRLLNPGSGARRPPAFQAALQVRISQVGVDLAQLGEGLRSIGRKRRLPGLPSGQACAGRTPVVSLLRGRLSRGCGACRQAGSFALPTPRRRSLGCPAAVGRRRLVCGPLADRLFLETLVRLHRMGEGVGFTGIQPSGTTIDPIVVAADRALETGDDHELMALAPAERREELHRRFQAALGKKAFEVDDVPAGREFVASYVSFFKFAEGEEHEHRHPAPGTPARVHQHHDQARH